MRLGVGVVGRYTFLTHPTSAVIKLTRGSGSEEDFIRGGGLLSASFAVTSVIPDERLFRIWQFDMSKST